MAAIFESNNFIVDYGNGEKSLERKVINPSLISYRETHTVLEGETLQSIAFKYYGDSDSWYLIGEANNILFPFDDQEVYPGRQLLIP